MPDTDCDAADDVAYAVACVDQDGATAPPLAFGNIVRLIPHAELRVHERERIWKLVRTVMADEIRAVWNAGFPTLTTRSLRLWDPWPFQGRQSNSVCVEPSERAVWQIGKARQDEN